MQGISNYDYALINQGNSHLQLTGGMKNMLNKHCHHNQPMGKPAPLELPVTGAAITTRTAMQSYAEPNVPALPQPSST